MEFRDCECIAGAVDNYRPYRHGDRWSIRSLNGQEKIERLEAKMGSPPCQTAFLWHPTPRLGSPSKRTRSDFHPYLSELAEKLCAPRGFSTSKNQSITALQLEKAVGKRFLLEPMAN
jgi:hypothetical protein